jgi:hypothetical protein
MRQRSLRATIVLTAMLALGTSAALGKTQSLRGHGSKSLATAEGPRFLELKMARTTDALHVQVRNRTGAEIHHGTVLVEVQFKNGVSQESRISIANLPAGGSSPVNLKLFGDEGHSGITAVSVVDSDLKGGETAKTMRDVPVKIHYE